MHFADGSSTNPWLRDSSLDFERVQPSIGAQQHLGISTIVATCEMTQADACVTSRNRSDWP